MNKILTNNKKIVIIINFVKYIDVLIYRTILFFLNKEFHILI